MRDDHLQGILFNQSELVDLLNRKRHQKFLKVLRSQRKHLQNWQVSKPNFTNKNKEFAIKDNRRYDREVSQLLGRFKDRSA